MSDAAASNETGALPVNPPDLKASPEPGVGQSGSSIEEGTAPTESARLDPTVVSRVIAATVFAAGIAVILISPDRMLAMVLLGPVFVGALLPMSRWPPSTTFVNGLEEAASRRLELAKAKAGKFSRFFSKPLLAGFLWIWKRTSPVADLHLRAGLRAALGLAFGALMLAALVVVGYILLIVAIAAAMLAFTFWILGKLLSEWLGSSSRREEAEEPRPEPVVVGPRGTRMVREGLFVDTASGTAVDRDGRIVEEGLFFDTPSGRKIDADGRLVEEGLFVDTPTGTRIDKDGRIVQEGLFVDIPTGKRIDDDGRLVEEGHFVDRPTGIRFVKD